MNNILVLVMSDLKLVYIRLIGETSDTNFEYEFFFSKKPDNVWGVDWEYDIAGGLDCTTPEMSDIDEIIKVKTSIPFITAQECMCYGMWHMVNNVICVAYEDISGYEEYPEPFRLVFSFGEDYDSISDKFSQREIVFGEKGDCEIDF